VFSPPRHRIVKFYRAHLLNSNGGSSSCSAARRAVIFLKFTAASFFSFAVFLRGLATILFFQPTLQLHTLGTQIQLPVVLRTFFAASIIHESLTGFFVPINTGQQHLPGDQTRCRRRG